MFKEDIVLLAPASAEKQRLSDLLWVEIGCNGTVFFKRIAFNKC